MSDTETFHLTTKDFTILEVMLERTIGRDETIRAILQRKIARATVMFRDDIAADVATLNSRVAYRVDDGPQETRIIAHDDMRGLVGSILPITNPRGLALLGLAEGQSMTIARPGGGRETLTLQRVLYQPEAARGRSRPDAGAERAGMADTVEPRRARPPMLRVVHSCDDLPPKPAPKAMAAADDGFDDPGPSAA